MKTYRASDIDEGILDLIDLMNEIPFVETWSSCSGHIYNFDERERRRANNTNAVLKRPLLDPNVEYFGLRGGYVYFYVSGTVDKRDYYTPKVDKFDHPLTEEFLGRVDALTEKYDYVDFRLMEIMGGNHWGTRPSYDFGIEQSVYGAASEPIVGKQKIDAAWDDLRGVCERFVEDFEPTKWKVAENDGRLEIRSIKKKLKVHQDAMFDKSSPLFGRH